MDMISNCAMTATLKELFSTATLAEQLFAKNVKTPIQKATPSPIKQQDSARMDLCTPFARRNKTSFSACFPFLELEVFLSRAIEIYYKNKNLQIQKG